MVRKQVISFVAIICLCMVGGFFIAPSSVLAKDQIGINQEKKGIKKLQKIIKDLNSLVGLPKSSVIKKLGEPEEKFGILGPSYIYKNRALVILFEDIAWYIMCENPTLRKFTSVEVEKILGKPYHQSKHDNIIITDYNEGKYHLIRFAFESDRLIAIHLAKDQLDDIDL
jgi:hypothetical protein